MADKPPTLTLILEQGDAALVVKASGVSELHRHFYAPEESVPPNVLLVTAIAMRIADSEDFYHEMIRWLMEHRKGGHGLPL